MGIRWCGFVDEEGEVAAEVVYRDIWHSYSTK